VQGGGKTDQQAAEKGKRAIFGERLTEERNLFLPERSIMARGSGKGREQHGGRESLESTDSISMSRLKRDFFVRRAGDGVLDLWLSSSAPLPGLGEVGRKVSPFRPGGKKHWSGNRRICSLARRPSGHELRKEMRRKRVPALTGFPGQTGEENSQEY